MKLSKLSIKTLKDNFYKLSNKTYLTITNGLSGVDQRYYLTLGLKKISYWQDVNIFDTIDNKKELFNMVVEIPETKKLKLELSKDEEYNPIKPDTKKDKNNNIICREYGIEPIFNYGFFPQTYESKQNKYRNLYYGDDDPLDVVEIGGNQNLNPGDIIKVRMIGCFCLIDQGEVDWKVIVVNDKLYNKVNKINYFDNIKKIQEWFRTYKVYEGKKENMLLDNNKIFTVEETIDVIEECRKEYKEYMMKLMNGILRS